MDTANSSGELSRTILRKSLDYSVRYESYRLLTYKGRWDDSYPVRPPDLARAGLFCAGDGDRVICAFCGNCLWEWTPGDDPMQEHTRLAGHECRFIQAEETQNVTIEDEVLSQEGMTPGETIIGEQTVSDPLVYESTRLLTFNTGPGWPKDSPVTPADLAKAGFYYLWSFDRVVCAFCEGVLRNWSPGDVPMKEHQKQFGNKCPFVQGHEVGNVTLAQEIWETEAATEIPEMPDDEDSGSDDQTCNVQEMSSALENIGLDDDNIRDTLMEMGYPSEVLDEALASYRQSHGSAPKNIEQVVNVIIEKVQSATHQNLDTDAENPASGMPQIPRPPAFMDSEQEEKGQEFLQREVDRLRFERQCKVCLDRPVEVVFLPCCHLVCCSACAQRLSRCAVCRKRIADKRPVYMA